MRKPHHILFYALILLFLLLLPAQAQQSATLNRAEIDPLSTGGADQQLGIGYIGTSTTLGNYKKCSTDATFYVVTVNKSSKDAIITLPRRIKVTNHFFQTDNSAFLCKKLPANWTGQNFADANAGQPCEVQNNQLTLPANTALSIRGTVQNFSHELTRGDRANNHEGSIGFQFDLQINNFRKNVAGILTAEGSICDALNFLDVSPHNLVEGGYFIDPTHKKSCSMNYFFVAENTDKLYSTVVELPRWVELNQNRFDVGCKFLYPGCKISGFRHYAWAILGDGQNFRHGKYAFCDQDRAQGDLCYEENSLWWLRIPPMTKIAIRGMVNNLCNDPELHPLSENMVEIGFNISDAGSNKWWIDGIITGTTAKNTTKDASLLGEYGRLEDRDANEPVNRYRFEDASLVDPALPLPNEHPAP